MSMVLRKRSTPDIIFVCKETKSAYKGIEKRKLTIREAPQLCFMVHSMEQFHQRIVEHSIALILTKGNQGNPVLHKI
jgi:hypothetical protein